MCNGCPYPDRNLDTNGQIKRTILAGQPWLSDQTDGYRIRFDTYGGEDEIDITFYQVRMPAATLDSTGSGVTERIYNEMIASGFDPTKIYLIFYEGGNNAWCGGGTPGFAAGLFLNGRGGRCNGGGELQTYPYLIFGALHELMHSFGLVASNAPNHACGMHVAEPNDLMSGCPGKGWDLSNLVFDVGRNVPGGADYFGPNVPPGVLKFEDSPFVYKK